MLKCVICLNEFSPKNIKRPSKTCSKTCKNLLARQITIRQFSDPDARDIQRQKSLEKQKDPEYRKKFKEGMQKRTKRWEEQGHPRLGMRHPPGTGEKISKANAGRFKGMSWEQIYGAEISQRRKIENSLSMSKKNEILLKEKRSSLENRILPYLPNYENNVQVSYYNVDFLNRVTKHIIEVNGNYWHCNPEIYSDDFVHPYFKMTAKERRNLDQQRKEYLESLGYSVTVVWESDLEEFIETLK